MTCAIIFDKHELGQILYEAALKKGYRPKRAKVHEVRVDDQNGLRLEVKNTATVQLSLSIEIEDFNTERCYLL